MPHSHALASTAPASTAPASTAPASLRVGFAIVPADPFWVQVREAVKQRAAEVGIDLVRLPPLPAVPHAESYLEMLENLRASELRALIAHAAGPSTLRAILDAGLPVLCAEESEVTHPLLVSVRGLDRAAEQAATFLAQRLQGKGALLITGGTEEHLKTARTRLGGFQSTIARYPAIRAVHVPTMWLYEEARDQLLEEAEQLHALFPNGHIDAIFGISDPIALGTRDACLRLGLADARTLVAGINGDPLAIAAIEARTMHATVETNPHHLGRSLADYALAAARGEALPDHFDYRLTLVSEENVAQVAARRLLAMAELPNRLVDVNRLQEEERLRQLRASIEMNRSLSAIVEWKELSRTLAEIIRSRYGYDHVQLFRWSAEEQCLLPATDAYPPARHAGDAATSGGAGGASILSLALLRNCAVYVPDIQSSHRFRPDPAWPATRARVVLPIRFAGRTTGVLDLHSTRPTVRTQAELDALQALADQLGSAMQNALLYDQALAARSEAEETNRMRARLLANLSYGLRSPLNVILGYVQSALTLPNPYNATLPGELVHDLRLIQQSGADLLRLVNELLELAQAESGQLPLYPEQVNPTELLGDLFRGAERVMGGAPGVVWQLQLPETLPALYTDPVRLRTVLMTLLSNAARFTHTGAIRLGAAAVEDRIHIWVEDTGGGIAPEALALLNAGAGERAEEGGPATPIGLGLGIARHLVSCMGGHLQISSRLGEGTRCWFALPCAQALAAAAAESAAAVERAATVERAAAEAASAPPAGAAYRLTLDRATTLVKQGVEYIESHYDEPFGRDDLARVLGVSPSYVSRIFQRELGLSPWEYLAHVRIERARTLLLAPEVRSVTEIALRVGFSDPAYFTRTFRRYTGHAPLAYRAQRGQPSEDRGTRVEDRSPSSS